MTPLGQILATVLWLYILLFLFRIVFDLVQAFSRGWSPRGPLLVIVELIYTLTDPPLKAVRKVVPPLRLGSVQLDLAFLVVLIGLNLLQSLALRL